MSDMTKDLTELVREAYAAGFMEACRWSHPVTQDVDSSAFDHDFKKWNNEVRTHHAEIARDREDAARWRALKWAEAPMVTATGSQLARGIRPGDFAVPWDWPITSKTRVRLIIIDAAMQESGE